MRQLQDNISLCISFYWSGWIQLQQWAAAYTTEDERRTQRKNRTLLILPCYSSVSSLTWAITFIKHMIGFKSWTLAIKLWILPLHHVLRRISLGQTEGRNRELKQQRQLQKTICLMIKITALHNVFGTFLWRPLHDYDVKPPNLTFYGGRGDTTIIFLPRFEPQ